MFKKFALFSKEMTFFGLLTLISGLRIADVQWLIDLLPDSIANPVVAVVTFLISVTGLILRQFFTDGKVTWNKGEVTDPRKVAAIEEIAGLIKTDADILDFTAAAKLIKEQRELADLEAQMARLDQLRAKKAALSA